jgi:hypothetical protein
MGPFKSIFIFLSVPNSSICIVSAHTSELLIFQLGIVQPLFNFFFGTLKSVKIKINYLRLAYTRGHLLMT